MSYTSQVTNQYKEETKHRRIRYTIQENLAEHFEIANEFKEWRSNQSSARIITFNNLFHGDYQMCLFDIRNAEIREDWGQRNALLDTGRSKKILGLAKNFDPMMFEPISVDYIIDEGVFIIRDGGGRAHAAIMNGVFMVPASVRRINSFEQSRQLFLDQDKYAQSIGQYDKFLQALADPKHPQHNISCDIFAISKSAKFCLHHSMKSTETPLIEGLGILKKTISNYGGDSKNSWGSRAAPNLVRAVDILKEVFPNNDEIPVSVLTAVTAFIFAVHRRLPSGRDGDKRLVKFFQRLINSRAELKDMKKWVSVLSFDSSNNYGPYGCAAFMREWNKAFKGANRGRKPKGFYKYVTFEDYEIELAIKRPSELARDESLYS